MSSRINNIPSLQRVTEVGGTTNKTCVFNHATADVASLNTDVTSTGSGRSAEFRINGTAQCYYGHALGFPGFVQPNATGYFFFGVANFVDFIFIDPISGVTTLNSPFSSGNTINANVGFRAPDGAVGAPSLFFLNSTTSGLYRVGADNVGMSIAGVLHAQWLANKYTIKAGGSTNQTIVGGTLKIDTGAVGNVGVGEDDLISYSVPASVLGANGDYLKIQVWGTFAANANAKRLKAKFGATTLFDTTALAFNNFAWHMDITIIRTSATTQKAIARISTDTVLLTSVSQYTTPAETLSVAVTFKCTGEATANNDVVQEGLIVESHVGV